MSTTTIRLENKVDGVPVDLDYAIIQSGVIRLDTNALVVPAGTALVRLSDGIYVYTFDDTAADLTYRYTLAWQQIGSSLIETVTQERSSAPPDEPPPAPIEPEPPDLTLVQAGISTRDRCPILRRLRAFLVQEGVAATLEHVFRGRDGNPLNLETPLTVSELSLGSASSAPSASSALSASSESAAAGELGVVLRVKEFTGAAHGNYKTRVHEAAGTIVNLVAGIVRVPLPSAIYNRAGLYQLSLAITRDGQPQAINEALLSVERSLFGFTASNELTAGPPTINEIRMHVMDSDAAENLLIDAIEFGDEQIAAAIAKPVMEFNERPPPLSVRFTTQNFPFRYHWLEAITAQLLFAAAHNYRRNRLAGTAGGVNIDDLNKESVYAVAARALQERWDAFLTLKKVELNAAACVGVFGSTYGRLNTIGS